MKRQKETFWSLFGWDIIKIILFCFVVGISVKACINIENKRWAMERSYIKSYLAVDNDTAMIVNVVGGKFILSSGAMIQMKDTVLFPVIRTK